MTRALLPCWTWAALLPVLLVGPVVSQVSPLAAEWHPTPSSTHPVLSRTIATDVVSNFSAAVGRLVSLVGVAGGGLLTLVWVRVALSWFSSDVAKKIQAKDRARDALIGTLIFAAALSGLVWGLAHWVVSGS